MQRQEMEWLDERQPCGTIKKNDLEKQRKCEEKLCMPREYPNLVDGQRRRISYGIRSHANTDIGNLG